MAISEEQIKRINALYKKAKEEGLNEDEKAEQQLLRNEYIASFRANLRGTLERVEVVNEDGSISKLEKKRNDKDNQYGVEKSIVSK